MIPDSVEGYRLSPQQQRTWQQGGGAWRSRAELRLEGVLSRPALSRALAAVVRRYEILRTAFPCLPGMRLPLQVIRPALPPPLPAVDLTALPAARREPAAVDVAREARRLSLDLETGVVCRALLIVHGPREHRLLLELSALAADPATLDLLAAELMAAYAAEQGEPAPAQEPIQPIQYADVADWQNQLLEAEETSAGVEIWRDEWRERNLDALLARPLPLAAGADPGGPFEPAMVETVEVDRAALGPVAAEGEAFLLACWQTLLARSAGEEETLVGVACDGRRYEELAETLGPCARYVPVHARPRGDRRFREVAAEAREALEEAARRQEHFAWDMIVGTGGPDHFPAGFRVDPAPAAHTAAGLVATMVRREAIVDRFDLELAWEAAGEGRLILRYDPRRFARPEVELLADRLATLVASAAAHPESALAELELIGERERRRLGAFQGEPAGAAPACLHHLFAAQAARSPERLAVASPGRDLTFAELDALSNRLARHLRALGVGPERPVGICFERSPDMLVAILGILKAGGAWVPLDPSHPLERRAQVAADAALEWVVTRGPVPLPPGPRRICLDVDAEAIAAEPATPLDSDQATPESLAYVIYTSGSTGKPKGVQVEHRRPVSLLYALTRAVPELAAGQPPLRASLNAPLAFDASVQQLVLLLAGHTLQIVPDAVRADGRALLAFLREHGVELFDCTPSQLRVLLDAGLLQAPGPVPRVVLTAGEALDEALWQPLQQSARTVFYNLYGPTECTVDATFHRIGAVSAGGPTIGRPLAGYEVLLLDAHLRPVPLGAPGEICVGGAGLARGYLGRPDATAERFVPHPSAAVLGERLYRTGDLARHRPTGDLEFLGRADHQIKIRGFRIEPGEVEAALAAHPGVARAVVVPYAEGPLGLRLVAYAVAAEPRPAPEELRRWMQQRLPEPMVPATFIVLDALPLTASGKVDRRALPAPQAERGAGSAGLVPPRDRDELELVAIWEELLDRRPLGVRDDFFELGGHSLLAIRLMARVEERFGHALPLADFFRRSTVERLATALREDGGAPRPWSPRIALQSAGSLPPFFCVHPAGGTALCYRDLAHHLGSEQPFYGLEASGLRPGEQPLDSVEAMAGSYLEAVRELRPAGPYVLGGWSFGGLVAWEMARQLAAAGETASVVLLDTLAPGSLDEDFDAAGTLESLAREAGLAIAPGELRPLAPEERLPHLARLATEAGLLPAVSGSSGLDHLERLAAVHAASRHAARLYTPAVFPGTVTLLRAAEPLDARVAELEARDPTCGWGTLVGGPVDIRRVPGNHQTMMREPYVRDLAEALRQALQQRAPVLAGTAGGPQ